MKITRFAQSCILVEAKNKRILVDPGDIEYKKSYLEKEWADIDMLLVTHKHGDHCYPEVIKEIVKNSKTKFHTTKEVAEANPELSPEIIKANDVLDLDGIKIEVTKAIHGYIPSLKGGKEIRESIGFIIDDGDNRIYDTGIPFVLKMNTNAMSYLFPLSITALL